MFDISLGYPCNQSPPKIKRIRIITEMSLSFDYKRLNLNRILIDLYNTSNDIPHTEEISVKAFSISEECLIGLAREL